MDLRAPRLAALAALTAGCLGNFEAPASPDLALAPLVDLAAAPADLTLRKVVILPEAPSDGAMAVAPANPRQRFDLTVAALLQARCVPCHGKEGGLGPALLKPPAYDSLLAWPRIVARDPTRSLLVAKGPHSGVAWWSPDEALTLLDWLGEEAAALPPGVDRAVATPPITPKDGANTIALGPLGKDFLGAEITFEASFISTTLRLAELTLRATGATGIHVVHPVLVILRDGRKLVDPVDSLDGVDLTVANAKSAPLGPGLLLLANLRRSDQLVIAFQRFEVAGPPAVLGGGCKAAAEFSAKAAPQLSMRCAPCHGGANGTATAALDLAKLMDPSMAGQAAACAQVLGRVNPGAPDKSQLFTVTAPTAPGNHAYKYPDQPSFDLFVQTVSQWIVKEK